MTQPQEQQHPLNPAPVTTAETPSELQLPADKVTTINIDDIKPNSILVINVDIDPEQKRAVVAPIAKLLSPFATQLREKCVTVMIMARNEGIDIVPESQMNNAGWEKKSKSLIIKPFEN